MSENRIRLGLLFAVNEGWIGGTYYILNLISALGKLPVEKKPIITILSRNKSDFEIAQNTGYPFLNFQNPYHIKRNLIERGVDKLSRAISKKNIFDKRISKKDVDVIFPATDEYFFERVEKKIYWFPDFQHIAYPNFFDSTLINNRNSIIQNIAKSHQQLVLSSEASKKDWDSLPIKKNCTVHVIPFAVTHPNIDDLKINDLLNEFKIEKDYFIISNQFWVHKNHFVVLKAAIELRKIGVSFQFVFTGNEGDSRQPGYFKSILDFITLHNLTEHIKMLGLIDRKKQLKLMQYAKAVIQPSLFEGWSTVIEDAKSLGKNIIASNLQVHKEQLNGNAYFFEPNSEKELADKIIVLLSSQQTFSAAAYAANIELFGQKFFGVMRNTLNKE